jgi:hypothetical protein
LIKGEALLLAHREVERNGLPWTEPVSVYIGIWNYEIWTKKGSIGDNVVDRAHQCPLRAWNYHVSTMADSRGGNIIIKVNRRSREATIVGPIPK